MDELHLYQIKTSYVKYLNQFDKKILNNEKNNNIRPYIGVVFEINQFKYYVPLSSPKSKHHSWRDRLDFIRLEDDSNLIAVLNINNMIPVPLSEITLLNIANEPEPYKSLLNKEYLLIKKKKIKIIKIPRLFIKKWSQSEIHIM